MLAKVELVCHDLLAHRYDLHLLSVGVAPSEDHVALDVDGAVFEDERPTYRFVRSFHPYVIKFNGLVSASSHKEVGVSWVSLEGSDA